MKHSPDYPSEDSNSVVDWMDAVANRRLTVSEIARLRRELAARPAELRRFEQEQALNSLLDARFATPAVSSNFAAQITERIAQEDRQNRATAQRHPWWATFWRRHPAWALAAVVLTAGILWQTVGQRPLSEMAATVKAVALTASSPGLPEESLEDYEAIRQLGTIPQPGDDALIAALAENSMP